MRDLNFSKHLKRKEDLVGKKFFHLKVLRFHEWKWENSRRRPYYECRCKCSKIVSLRGDHLGLVKSCGCLQKERIAKGERNARAALSNDSAKAIREIASSGLYTNREIAKMFSVSENIICRILKNSTYLI